MSRHYSTTPLPKKLGIKEDSSFCALAPPDGAELGELPDRVRGGEPFDVILFFVHESGELRRRFAEPALTLDPAGGLWVAWPKRGAKLSTDLSFAEVQRIGLETGLVDNKSCAIDERWQALRFVVRLEDRPRG